MSDLLQDAVQKILHHLMLQWENGTEEIDQLIPICHCLSHKLLCVMLYFPIYQLLLILLPFLSFIFLLILHIFLNFKLKI